MIGDLDFRARAIDLDGKTFLIIGFERIDAKLQKKLRFDLKVFGYDTYVDDVILKAANVEPVVTSEKCPIWMQ